MEAFQKPRPVGHYRWKALKVLAELRSQSLAFHGDEHCYAFHHSLAEVVCSLREEALLVLHFTVVAAPCMRCYASGIIHINEIDFLGNKTQE